jgi:hypothetical protein
MRIQHVQISRWLPETIHLLKSLAEVTREGQQAERYLQHPQIGVRPADKIPSARQCHGLTTACSSRIRNWRPHLGLPSGRPPLFDTRVAVPFSLWRWSHRVTLEASTVSLSTISHRFFPSVANRIVFNRVLYASSCAWRSFSRSCASVSRATTVIRDALIFPQALNAAFHVGFLPAPDDGL